MMGIWSETQECEECGRTYTSTLYDIVTDNGNSYVDRCSKRCFERSWAATMDGYDVDDPNNPMYSSPASSGDGCLVDILLLFFTSVLVLGLIALSEIVGTDSLAINILVLLIIFILIGGACYFVFKSFRSTKDKKSEEPSILKNVLSILFLIYALALVKYNFFS